VFKSLRLIIVRVYVKHLWVSTQPVLCVKSSNVVVHDAGSVVVRVASVVDADMLGVYVEL
jgi:hypothetical protein